MSDRDDRRPSRLPILGGPGDDIHGQSPSGAPGFSPSTSDLGQVVDGVSDLRETHEQSVLDQQPALADLLDIDAFREICASFVDLYKIGIKIFDADGTKLVDIRVGNGDWCGYIFSNRTGRGRCTALVTRIKQFGYSELEDGEVVEQLCFSGLKYVVMPVSYAGDLLGRVVYGPFLPADLQRPGQDVYEFGEGFDPHRLWQYGDKIRRAPDETIMKILTNFRGVVDTVTFIAMKSVMTRKLHVESITASYNELAEANHKLQASVERLQEVDRMKSAFLAMVSHELKTPLTSVIGYSEMLIEGVAGDLNGDQRKYLGTIRNKGESLLGLIGSLLDLSRMEAGALELTESDVDIADLVEDAVTSIVPQAVKKSINVQRDLDRAPRAFKGDRDKLRQVFVNLLGNAVKFTPERGYIGLVVDVWRGPKPGAEGGRFGPPDEDFVRFRVSDDGIGIPPEKVDRIFESFYQVDSSITREYGGSGLGLAITKKLIDAHRGDIQVSSQRGRGTTFTILLPRG
ncbi:MAG: ATP-binding protein [Myxococcota bacterium]